MLVAVENVSNLERRLSISVPADEIEQAVQKKLRELMPKAKVPGFRAGKVPFAMLQKRFGDSARGDVIDEMIRKTYTEALQQEKLRPTNYPEINIVNDKPDAPFSYNATIEIYPDVKLGNLPEITVERTVCEITEQDMQDMLEKLQRERVQWQEIKDAKRTAQKDDQLVIDFSYKVHSIDAPPEPVIEKDVKFVLGSGYMWADFESSLYGTSAGDTKQFTLKFPLSHIDKSLVGKQADFDVKVIKVSAPNYPALDDEFAKKMHIKEGGIAGLKLEVRKNMERELQSLLKNIFKQHLLEKLYELHPIEVPKSLLEGELDNLEENWRSRLVGKYGPGYKTSIEFPRMEYVKQAGRNVAMGLLLATVIKDNSIKVEPNELREKIEDLASIYEDSKPVIDYYYSHRDKMLEVESMLLEEKAADFLATQVKTVDKPISYKDAMSRR